MRFTYLPSGGASYVTSQGDVLDLIAFNFYGDHPGNTERLYAANRDLALVPQPYAAGITILLPPPAPRKPAAQIQLWD
ncbi:MAG: tail protein X [Devosia sp.]|uniref:tail protein X n=1 Tax=Devosia sp. TaxID=1871048 RepID=UPI001AC558C3|nr:tail protein X [Devosia sp.]MBN9308350.1 tail protein X [Devosia sp.]MBN9314260.1 tail protein X [Devosia sp.]